MMAQIDILLEHGHPYSEVANESRDRVRSTRSTPTCTRAASPTWSTTARRRRASARASGPRASTTSSRSRPTSPSTTRRHPNRDLVPAFKEHVIHDVLAECAKLRPSVDIFVE